MSEHLPIIKIPSGFPAPGRLVCGDPFRAELIAGMPDEAEERAWNRRWYLIFTGSSRGVPLAVCLIGVGAAGAAVCFELLDPGRGPGASSASARRGPSAWRSGTGPWSQIKSAPAGRRGDPAIGAPVRSRRGGHGG